jgi:hypothetical protein
MRNAGGRSRPVAPIAALVVLSSMVPTLLAGPAPAATDCPTPPAVFPESQLAAGMAASGLTTLSGQSPIPFDVQIIGIIPDGIITGLDLIVAQITGPQSFLDKTGGILYGMSGSPVSIGGKLVGSTSYAWYGDLTIIGITPAQPMVDLFSLPGGGASTGATPSRVELTPQLRSTIAATSDTALSAVPTGLSQMTVPLGVSGLPDSQLAKFQKALDKYHAPFTAYHAAAAPPPRTATLDPTPIAPGKPFASALSYGDFSVYAIGTATATCGDLTVAYGHPLFYYPPGPTTFGMSDATILTVVKDSSGLFGGFKLGVIGAPHGTIVQDRFAGEVGRAGVAPPTVQVVSDFTSPDTGKERVGETDIAWQDEYAVPEFSFYHAWLNLAAVFQRIGSGTLGVNWTIEGTRADGSPWTLSSSTMEYSEYDASSALYKLSFQLYAIAFNRFEDISFTGIDMDGSITADQLESTIARIRTASALQPSLRSRSVQKVRKGKRLTVEVTLAPVERGPNEVVTLKVRPGYRPGKFPVSVRGGKDRYDFSRREVGSFDELLARLGGAETENDLMLSGGGIDGRFPQDVIVQGKSSFTIKVV